MLLHSMLAKISVSPVRLTRLALLVVFLLAGMLAVNGVSTALAVDAPQLISPANYEETTGNPSDPISGRVLYEPLGIPTFEWTDVGASKYELEIASTASFGGSVIFDLNNLQYSTFTPGTNNGEGETVPGFGLTESSGEFIDSATFYWHVRAWDDASGTWGEWSPKLTDPPWEFTRHWGYEVQLSYPADNSVQTQTPYFEWEPVPGASFYQIQVDTSNSFGSPSIDAKTDVPVYTPLNTLPNDTDLFWRVRAFHRPNTGTVTGGRGGPWSEVRKFQLAWSSKVGAIDNRPLQLMPISGQNYVVRPLFCWRPVAGASKYRVDLATQPDFVTGSIVFKDKETEGTCYYAERDGTYTLFSNTYYYWRVTAYDARGYPGQRTDEGGSAPFIFRTDPSADEYVFPPQVPTRLSPFPYYPPIMEDTFEDRTIALPTFVWDHVRGATSYQLRLDDDLAMTDPPIALIDTQNSSYTFTDADTYPLNDGQVYYWRVRALGAPQGEPTWSQILGAWPVRIDRSQVEVYPTIQLIQPTYQSEPWTDGHKYGRESVTYFPSMSWTAIAPIGDVTYQIQISRDNSFSAQGIIYDAQTDFPEYTPQARPAPGTYYWRVRRVLPTTSTWSETGRFVVSRNFTFIIPEIPPDPAEIVVDGDVSDWILAGVPLYSPSGESGDAPSAYDMAGSYIANDGSFWYLGIDLPQDAALGLYLDVDHFQPEYALYWSVDQPTGAFYQWNGSSWTFWGPLSNIGATQAYSDTTEFLELKIPVVFVSQPASLSVEMVSMDGSGVIQDRMPNLPGQLTATAFLTESTSPTPLYPANAPQNADLVTIEHNTPVLTWRHNEAGYSGTYFYETFEDETLSNLYESENGNVPKVAWFWSYNTFWAPKVHYSDNNSYHWRIKRSGFESSAPNHFRKAAYLPVDLQFEPVFVDGALTYTNRTPSFSWQAAQSAPKYVWELWLGGSRVLNKITMIPYFTPDGAIKDGTYTWKVYAMDARGNNSAEAAQGEFRKVSDVVSVHAVEYVSGKLVFSWDPVDFAAWYHLEIADDPQFSLNKTTVDTYSTTFTPRVIPGAVKDGVFYWRVCTKDNKNNLGPYIDLQFDLFPNKIYLPLTIR